MKEREKIQLYQVILKLGLMIFFYLLGGCLGPGDSQMHHLCCFVNFHERKRKDPVISSHSKIRVDDILLSFRWVFRPWRFTNAPPLLFREFS